MSVGSCSGERAGAHTRSIRPRGKRSPHAVPHRAQRYLAHERPLAGGGVRGAIFKAAGPAKLTATCEAVAPCPTGRTVSTPAFGLSARRIVHAVEPRLIDGAHGEKVPLRSTDASTLAESARLGAQSMSPPLISAGIFGYPPAAALAMARDEARLPRKRRRP